MEQSIINQLEEFLNDIGFPIDKMGLVQESHEFPLSHNVRDAIALLPDKEYASRMELKEDLLGVPFENDIPKKDLLDEDEEDDLHSMETPESSLDASDIKQEDDISSDETSS